MNVYKKIWPLSSLRMRRKYTALIPKTIKATRKTIKATRKTSKKFLKKLDYYIKNGTMRLKKIPKSIDNRLSMSIRSLTNKR
jgi:hypothetical protein